MRRISTKPLVGIAAAAAFALAGATAQAAPLAPSTASGIAAAAETSGATGTPVQYCASRFRSYDPRSGTYLGYDGYRHACP
jgi:hypothetical protein